MLDFLVFNFIIGMTPGPNNTLALSEGRAKGFQRSQVFVLSAVFGNLLLGLLAGLVVSWFIRYPVIMFGIRVIGTVYLLYLAWHIFKSDNDITETSGLAHPIRTGISLQFVNPKAYLAIVTSFSVMAKNVAIPVKLGIILVMIYAFIALWAGIGQLLRQLFVRYGRVINTLLAGILLFSTLDLWL